MVSQVRGEIEREQPFGRSRGTLGILLRSLGDFYSNLLLAGLIDYTQSNDLNFGIVLMEGFRNTEGELGEYEWIAPERFDGLVLTGALAYREERGLDRLRSFRSRYPDLPMVGVLLDLDQMASVAADGYVGMRQAVEHLIDVHGHRRLAFIGGPASSLVAQERHRAYVDALASRGLSLVEDWVLPGDFTAEAGVSGVQRLLQQGAEIDALVCSNDETAIGALEVLHARGVRVPEDLAVIGFDDVKEAAQIEVPLTTVRQPVYEMGKQGAEILHRLITGRAVGENPPIPTELVVRRSCGCLPSVVTEISVVGSVEADEEFPQSDSLADCLADAIEGSVPSDHLLLMEALVNDLEEPASTEFVRTLDRILSRFQQEGRDGGVLPYSFSQWQKGLTVVRRKLLRGIGSAAGRRLERICRLEDLFQQARILVGQAENRWQAHQQMIANQRREAIEWFQAQTATLTALDELPSRFDYVLPRLQLNACYLSTPMEPGDSVQPEDRASLALRYAPGERENAGEAFSINRLLPEETWSARLGSTPAVFSVLPMSVGDEYFGVSVFWGRPDDFGVCDQLGEAVTGIIRRTELLEDLRAAVDFAEEERRRADIALRDALVAQQRYLEQTWEGYTAPIRGYQISPGSEGPTETAWVSGMQAAVLDNRWVANNEGDKQTLSLPLALLGDEIIGVLGFTREGQVGWTEEEVRTAQAIAEQAALALENQRLVSDVQRRAARLAAASEVSSAASSLTDLDELLSRVVTLIRDRFDLYYAGIFLVDDARQWAVLVAGSGEAGRRMLARGHRLEVGGDSMIGYCVATGNARITYDVMHEERRRPNPLLPDTRSELALPLISQGEVMGAMTIQDEMPGAFTEDDITTLQTMAAQLANAITNAQLLERMEQNVRELRAVTGQYTHDAWRDYLEKQSGARGYRYRLVDVASVADRHPEADAAWSQDRTVVTTFGPDGHRAGEFEDGDTPAPRLISEGEGAGIGVPIRLRNQVLGVLNVRFEDAEVPAETIRLVEQVADRLALSLESARLLAETRRVALRERMIGDVTDRMRRTLDWDDLMQTTTLELREMLDASRVFIQWRPPQAGDPTGDGAEES